MTRKTTWTNSDGLVVGFGPNYAERQKAGVTSRSGDVKEAKVSITYQSTTGSSGAVLPIPAGSIVKNVYFRVDTAWAGGTAIIFGDATDPDGFLTAAGGGALANLTPAGKKIQADGAYIAATTDTTAINPPKEYASATDLYFTVTGTMTAGALTAVVEYV